jgi:hypothetical protein
MERHWFGILNPWDQFIGERFGNYRLMSYYNLPNSDPSNIPPSYLFTLVEENSSSVLKVNACNILQLEHFILHP